MEKKQAILVPMIALRGMSIFPGMAISFPAGRQKSLDALQAAEENGKEKMQKVLACDRDRAKEKFCQKMDSAGISYTISQIMPIDTGIWC